jgi:cold shock CspA family protein
MRIGKVDWYSEKRGFGILSSPASDGALDKFFCHITKIVRSPETIEQGQHATFDVSAAPLRHVGDLPMALNVTIENTEVGEPIADVSKAAV